MIKRIIISLAALILSSNSYAALIDTGAGLINDTAKNITWLKDANVFKTLCDANDPIYTGWAPSRLIYTKEQICADNGALHIFDANAWVQRLNDVAYLGYSNWRMYKTNQPDYTCSEHFDFLDQSFPPQLGYYNCIGSELPYLFYKSAPYGLDNSNFSIENCHATPDVGCFKNTRPFTNTQAGLYWSETVFAPDHTAVWSFNTYFGLQIFTDILDSKGYVWPILDGIIEITAPPPLDPDTIVRIEEPRNNSYVAGVGNLRGWAIGWEGIVSVEYFVDGEFRAELPYGATRNDIKSAYPDYLEPENSGYAKSINYGNFTPGEHTILVRATDINAIVTESSSTFNVVRFDEAFFANPADMVISGSIVSQDGQYIYVEGLVLKEKTYNVRLQWQASSQKFEIVGIDSVN